MANVAMPLGVFIQDSRELLSAQVAQNALFTEGVMAKVTANQISTFSTPPAMRLRKVQVLSLCQRGDILLSSHI